MEPSAFVVRLASTWTPPTVPPKVVTPLPLVLTTSARAVLVAESSVFANVTFAVASGLDSAVVGEQHVAGVRIGVEKAVEKYLVEVGEKQVTRQLASVELRAAERPQRREITTRDPLHREHSRSAVVGDR